MLQTPKAPSNSERLVKKKTKKKLFKCDAVCGKKQLCFLENEKKKNITVKSCKRKNKSIENFCAHLQFKIQVISFITIQGKDSHTQVSLIQGLKQGE